MGRKEHYCGFCGKEKDEIKRMLSGPCINVCNECIDMMHKIVHEPKPILPVKPMSTKPRTVIPFRPRMPRRS